MFDLIILAILLFATIRGAVKGIVWQLAAIAALVLCFAFAESASLIVAPAIAVKPPANRWIAMLIIYVGLSFVSFGLARVLRSWIEKAKFVEFDRHLGALFGLLKGTVFCLVLIFFVVTLSESYRQTILNSYSGYAAAVLMDRLHPVMPHGLQDVIEPYIHSLDRPGMNLRNAHQAHEVENPFRPGDNPFETGTNPDAKPGFEIPPFFDELVGNLPPSNPFNTSTPTAPATPSSGTKPPVDLRALLTEALVNTAVEHQAELKDLLLKAGQDRLQDVAEAWRNGKPGTARTNGSTTSNNPFGTPSAPTTGLPATEPPFFGQGDDAIRPSSPPTGTTAASIRTKQADVLREISELFSDSPSARAGIIEEIQAQLVGLPDQVSLAVLEDWSSDLLERKPDPVPETTIVTLLDQRIVAHLTRARIPISSLSNALQTRLRDVQRQ